MSAAAVADAVVQATTERAYDFILVNFANPDMVGHTGKLDAAIDAVDAVDAALGRVVEAVRARRRRAPHHGRPRQLRAHEGPCDGGAAHVAHDETACPCLRRRDAPATSACAKGGRICDVAPTLLQIRGQPQPAAMTGRSLFGTLSA